MSNTYLPIRQALDPIAARYFRWLPESVNRRLPERLNRDEMRTPMQWDDSPNAGFTPAGVVPWLPVNDNRREINVATESKDPDSILSTYRDLLVLRRSNAALRNGSLTLIGDLPAGVLGYRRQGPAGQQFVVLANLGERPRAIRVDGGSVELTVGGAAVTGGCATLPPDSAVVLSRA